MIRFLIREKFTILLALAVLNAIAAPFVGMTMDLKLFLNLTFSAVMITAVLAVFQGQKLTLAGAVILLLPCLFFLWVGYLYSPGEEMLLAASVLEALFILYMALLILMIIFHSPRVTRDVIAGAVVVYIFMALFFSKLYLALELMYPGSFSLPHARILSDPGLLGYFSMSTLSTLGYGDIVPVSPQARAMAGGQALIGPMYLAVLIARLVSMHGQRVGWTDQGL